MQNWQLRGGVGWDWLRHFAIGEVFGITPLYLTGVDLVS